MLLVFFEINLEKENNLDENDKGIWWAIWMDFWCHSEMYVIAKASAMENVGHFFSYLSS